MVCGLMKFDDEAKAVSFKEKVVTVLDEENIFSVSALIKTATESFLGDAKLRALWPYMEDLQERKAQVAARGEKKEKAPLSGEKLAKRKKQCIDEWKEHTNNIAKTLKISDDGLKFACTVCSAGGELKWQKLRGPSDVRRHCIGGASSTKNEKTPEESAHAKNMAKKKKKKAVPANQEDDNPRPTRRVRSSARK